MIYTYKKIVRNKKLSGYGFIRDELKIKFLILYVLKNVEMEVQAFDLSAMCLCDDAIDFFDYSSAVEDLVNTGHVVKTIRDGTEWFSLGEKSRDMIDVCEQNLPYSVKKDVQREILIVSSRLRRESDIKGEIITRDDGSLAVRLQMKDDTSKLLSMEVFVTSEDQGNILIKNFKRNAENIFGKIINTLIE